jgi:hypothetical protein
MTVGGRADGEGEGGIGVWIACGVEARVGGGWVVDGGEAAVGVGRGALNVGGVKVGLDAQAVRPNIRSSAKENGFLGITVSSVPETASLATLLPAICGRG